MYRQRERERRRGREREKRHTQYRCNHMVHNTHLSRCLKSKVLPLAVQQLFTPSACRMLHRGFGGGGRSPAGAWGKGHWIVERQGGIASDIYGILANIVVIIYVNMCIYMYI